MNMTKTGGLFFVAAALFCGVSPQATSQGTNSDLARQLNQAFIDVVEKVSPSVVVINAVQKVEAFSADDEREDKTFDSLPPGFWRRFHEELKRGQPDTLLSQGSGVIIRENGYILTNGHVVEDAERIEVRLKDGRIFPAVVRGVDPQSDIAVLKIEATGLPVAPFGDSARTRVGEFAVAIGAPFSLDYSVTFGHVSAKGRSHVIETTEGAAMDQDFIQTDALINPGNSGGPLVNIEGEVIGINTLIHGLHTGIGFAVPSSLAREVADELVASGKFLRLWLGIGIAALRDSPDLREVIPGIEDGVVVSRIIPDGPAAKSELKPTDVITAVNGKTVSTPQQLRAAIRGQKLGQMVTLDVFRKGKTLQVQITPSEWVEPPANLAKATPAHPAPAVPVNLGLTVKPLTRELAAHFTGAPAEGVVVASVEKNSPAARKGLKPGDIITAIDQQDVTTPKQFRDLTQKTDLKKGVLVNLVSGNTARFEILKQP
jgi:serine protease Do